MPYYEVLPSGSVRASVYVGYVDGVRKYEKFTAETQEEAAMLAYEYLIDLKKKLKLNQLPLDMRMTVGDAIDQHIADIADTLSPTTVRRYMKDREKFFAQLMDMPLAELTQPDINRAVSHDSRLYAPKSIHCAHGLLSSALGTYYPDFRLKTNLPQIVEADVIVPEDNDIRRFLARIKGTWMERAVMLGACCGMRRSEICGLKYTDVDVKKSTISIRRTVVKDVNGKWILREKTKTTKSKRTIEVSTGIIQRLFQQQGDSEFVVPVVPDTISKTFIDLRNELRIECRFHDLRHYNASIMLAMNIPDKYAMERMGYATAATLKKVYQHTMRGKRKEVSDMVNGYMDGLLEPNEDEEKDD